MSFSGRHPHRHTITHAACGATGAAYSTATSITTSAEKG